MACASSRRTTPRSLMAPLTMGKLLPARASVHPWQEAPEHPARRGPEAWAVQAHAAREAHQAAQHAALQAPAPGWPDPGDDGDERTQIRPPR